MQNERWGIDLTGRKMRYEPWNIDHHGHYKPPDSKEMEDVFSISGEAVHETLLFFEECGGDTNQLIQLLNNHILDNRFLTNRENLLDKTRWYNYEYYFYFIMFTKRVMNDYNWHFKKGEDVQLSEYHKIFEHGFLCYLPYGEGVKDNTNLIPFAIIKHYSSKGYDFSDLFAWSDALTKEKTTISYKNDVSHLDNYWICGEFLGCLYCFLKIILNNISYMEMVHEGFDSYHLGGLSYVPESMLTKIIPYFIKKSSNFYEIKVSYHKNNAIKVILEQTKKRKAKTFIYTSSICKTGSYLVIAAIQEVIKKLLKLDKLPEIKEISGLSTGHSTFTLKWEKRILSVPYLHLLFCNITAVILLLFTHSLPWINSLFIILFFIPINMILILLRRLKLEKYKREIVEDHIISISEDNNKRLEKAEELSNELMLEKAALEKKVIERTARLAEANKMLQELDVAKTNFFANISHELRTPLTLILGSLDSIKNKDYGDRIGYNDEIFKLMLHNGLKLLKLINNLLDFTKIEAGKMIIKKQKTDLTELLKFYTSIVRTYAESKSINIVFNDNTINPGRKSGKVITWIDRDLLDKAIFNLLSNSLKFTPKGGSVIIQLDQEEDYFIISIKDTGIGIPEDKLDAVFERFNQVDGSSSRLYEGTGIGLALTKEIVELLGGKIAVTSRLGEGSVFTITLPYCKMDENDVNDHNEGIQGLKSYLIDEFQVDQMNDLKNSSLSDMNYHKAANPNKKKVLIVEDSIDMQKYLSSILGDDYNLLLANNGKEGLQQAKKNKPDLVLTDIMMPEMDGYTLTRLIKTDHHLKGIPLIMLTAKADIFMMLEGFEKGADDYIIKPFSTKELKARIKAHLEVKELRDEVIRQRDEILDQKNIVETALNEKNSAFIILNESEIRFREMVNDLPAGVIEFDLNMDITFINPAGCELLQIHLDDIKNRGKILDFIRPAAWERFNLEMKHVEKSTNTKLIEFQFYNKKNEDLTILMKAAPIFKANQAAGFRTMIIEVKTNLNIALLPDDQFYEQYQISRREKEVFVYIIKGFKNKDICDKLFIAERTVKKHITNILQKTGCTNRSELISLVQAEKSK